MTAGVSFASVRPGARGLTDRTASRIEDGTSSLETAQPKAFLILPSRALTPGRVSGTWSPYSGWA